MDKETELDDRLNMQVQQHKQWLKKTKSREGQQPTQDMLHTRAQLEQAFLAAALMHKLRAPTNQHHMVTIIGDTYPPSVEPISSLTPIVLRDLRLEIHHRGRLLVVKTFCEPIRVSVVQNAIEDIQSSVNWLSIYNLPSATPVDRALPKGAIVAVKEPYLTATPDGGTMVQVDHPSDFVLLEPHDPLVPPQWRSGLKAAMTGSQLKEEGNTAFKQGDWQKAAEFYSEGLAKTDNSTDLRSTLRRNRAQVHLNLGQYEFASEDAIAAVIVGVNLPHRDKMLNVKSYFRAGRAQYQLGHFCMAKKYLDQALCLDPTDETVIADLARTKQRLLEEQSGHFDFIAMAKSATITHRELDHATFTGNTRIAAAGKRGRGLFATKDIDHGGLVMVEKAFCVTFGDELGKDKSYLININTDRVRNGTHSEFLCKIMSRMRNNPQQASKFLGLFDGGKFKRKEVSLLDGTVVLDIFQAQAIAEINSFNCPIIRSGLANLEQKEGGNSNGIWLHASHMNHSCLPNTASAFNGDMMIVRATCDIKAGEEILTSYKPVTTRFPKRNETLRFWGFQCDCRLCRLEKQVPASVFRERERLEQEAEDFITANPRTLASLHQPVGAGKLAQAKDILRRLELTHETSMYEAFPRLACVAIDTWLVEVGLTSPQAGLSHTSDCVATTRLLHDFGYKVTVKGSKATIDRANGVVCEKTMEAAWYSQMAWCRAGKPEVAKAFVELAKELYLAIRGSMDGVEEKFGGL